MNNKPFRFLNSADAIRQLRSRLSEVGFDARHDGSADGSDICFTCRFDRNRILTLRWQYKWWPDGIQQEDQSVVILDDDDAVASVNVCALLGRKLDRPLRDALTDQIVEAVQSLTWDE